MSELEWAKSEVAARTDHSNTAKAFQILADASANLSLRPNLQDEKFFGHLLKCFLDISNVPKTSFDPDLLRNILRCLGNLVADNEENRSLVISNSECLDALNNLLTSDISGSDATVVAHTAIKVIFNLCNDYTPSQQKCFEHDIHQSLIYCLDRRPPTDESIWGLALDLIAMIVENKRELRPSEDYPDFQSFAPRLLKLPLTEFDPTAFFDALTVVVAYFQDENFIKAVVDNKQMHHVWEILRRIEERSRVDREVEDEEDYEEKQYLQFQLLFSQSLADMSSLPLFNEKYHSSDGFIKPLIPQIIPTSTDPKDRSPIPPAACLIVGNLITSDADAISLIPQIPLQDLFSHIGRSNDTGFLNAASGLLRHLATPVQNRENHFANKEYIRLTQHLYTDVSLEQVQVGGLALTRQMLVGMKSKIIFLLTEGDDNFLSTLLTTYQNTTSTSVKLEMTRLIVTLLRALQPDSSTSAPDASESKAVEALLDTPVNLPSILDPILFSIKHAPEPNIVAIQAEAWLGLNLLVRLPGGVTKAAAAVSEDEELFSLFTSRLEHSHGQVAKEGEESKDSRPDWLKEKERDNAVLLSADVLRAEGVDEETKRKFREALGEKDISVK